MFFVSAPSARCGIASAPAPPSSAIGSCARIPQHRDPGWMHASSKRLIEVSTQPDPHKDGVCSLGSVISTLTCARPQSLARMPRARPSRNGSHFHFSGARLAGGFYTRWARPNSTPRQPNTPNLHPTGLAGPYAGNQSRLSSPPTPATAPLTLKVVVICCSQLFRRCSGGITQKLYL